MHPEMLATWLHLAHPLTCQFLKHNLKLLQIESQMIEIGSGVLPPCSPCPGWPTCTVALLPVFCRQCHVSSSVA